MSRKDVIVVPKARAATAVMISAAGSGGM